jgi:hypothetical protein
VAYHIYISDANEAYLEKLPLSTVAKERVSRFIQGTIANVTDEIRFNLENRPDPTKPCFKMSLFLLDFWGDRHAHTLEFHIRDETAQFGVLVLAYVDHWLGRSLDESV